MTEKQIVSFALGFRRGLLNGRSPELMCRAICFPLQSALSIYGVESEIEEVEFPTVDHVWLRLESGKILDPTYDQFFPPALNPEKVYLGPVPEIFRRWIEEAKA